TASDPTGLESCYPNYCAGSNGTYGTYKEENDPGANQDDDDSGDNGTTTTTTTTGTNNAGSGEQPVIQGIRLPTEKELRALPLAWPGDTYDELTAKWARGKCGFGSGGFSAQNTKGFCDTVLAAGLLETGDDPWGVKANIDCITGKGRCGEALVQDILTIVTWGVGKLLSGPAAAAVRAGGAGAKGAGKGAVARLLGAACQCFLAGTEVKLADGSTKPIEEIEMGDTVLATDPETGETGSRKVIALIRTEADKLFNALSITTSDGIEQLTATYEHPFWSPSEHTWLAARDLEIGMTLLTDAGETVLVSGNTPFSRHARTYNMTVEGLHTYYVLAGETPVLVHNAGNDQTPNIILRGIQQIQDGTLAQRRNPTKPDGTPGDLDFFTNKEKNKRNNWWVGAKIYAPDPLNNDYRILEKNGQFKWVGPKGGVKGAGHFYGKLMDITPCT
ncbi:Hint domain-containing protein, partial [Streptomyces omiyaensis]|uniref:Hint domain-containing protein n=1 Tax=Streptomyces omiyaensis TaxID=68247 RepID=UPI00370354D5